ncbi:MAG: ABC transporter permease [Candidatus Aminicenantes bacterium]|nr:ABC transporter permease [Candidatus Aminicenantes bacterium]
MSNFLPRPPRLATRILRFFLRLDEEQEKMGDFDEGFQVQVESEGIHRARSWYRRQLLRVIPTSLKNHLIWSVQMFKNYFKITVRNLLRYKGYSFINLFGLALGMACCLLIFLFIQRELSYDRFHEHSDRIFRVTREWFNQDGTSSLHLGHVAPPIGPLLQNDFPEIEQMVRILNTDDTLCSRGDKHFIEENLLFADTEFFQVFSFRLKKGDPATALQEPFSVVITERTAEKYFGTTEPIWQTLQFDNRLDAKITGIIEEAPSNSHFHFNIIGSLSTLKRLYGADEFENWSSNNYATYFLLPEGYDPDMMSSRFPDFLEKHRGEDSPKSNALHLWPLTSIHLHSHLDSELEANSDISSIYIFSAVGLFILLIACINFMNLSTARSSLRAKEVGMRKVVGAPRSQIIRQFLSESLLLAFLSMLLALAIVRGVLPSFSRFVSRELTLDMISQPFLPIMLVSFFLFVGLSAGIYPALFLSAFRPSHVLKGSRGGTGGGSAFRKALVVFQFTISIILVISVSVVR